MEQGRPRFEMIDHATAESWIRATYKVKHANTNRMHLEEPIEQCLVSRRPRPFQQHRSKDQTNRNVVLGIFATLMGTQVLGRQSTFPFMPADLLELPSATFLCEGRDQGRENMAGRRDQGTNAKPQISVKEPSMLR